MPASSQWSLWSRRLLAVFAALLALAALSAGGFLLWLESAAGRRYVARRFESGVSEQIRGRLTIAEITSLSRRGLRARGVRFVSPRGDDVLVVDDLELDLQWSALLRGRFIAPRGRARGGRVVLRDDAQGRLALDEAFRSRAGSGSAPSGVEAPIDIRGLVASGVTLVAHLRGVPATQGTDVRGLFHVWAPTPGARVRLDASALAGRVSIDTPVTVTLRVTTGTLHFDGGDRHRASVDLRGLLGSARARLQTSVTTDGDDARVAAHLTLSRDATPLDALPLVIQASVASIASPSFHFSVSRE